MNRARPIIIIALLIAAAVAALLLLRRNGEERQLSGYIEGDTLFLSAPVAGTVRTVTAEEGQRIDAGARLFTIDPATLAAEGDQARAEVAGAGSRIAAADAAAAQARSEAKAAAAEAERARRDLDRLLSVQRDDPAAVAGREVDAARAALREANARLGAASDAARARERQAAAARAEQSQARGSVREVAIRLDQLSPPAPSAARVEQIFYRPGEWVAANQPVVSLLPDERVKVRFFVPQAEVARYRPGRTVSFSCDGCRQGLSARISYISPRPEFTPPVIFSRDSRDRLVFMVEAIPAKPAGLMPGLPVDVEPLR